VVIDTSALIAVLLGEPPAERLQDAPRAEAADEDG
jgi:uncharacterized protein with PIN domain